MKEFLSKVYNKDKDSFYKLMEEKLLNEQKTFVITANPEILMAGDRDKEFSKILLDERTTIIADGIGIVKGAKAFGIDLPGRITGVDLVVRLIELCNEYKKSMYFFGAKQEVLDKLKTLLEQKYPGVNIVGMENGYAQDKQKVMEDIKAKKPDVVLVALGGP